MADEGNFLFWNGFWNLERKFQFAMIIIEISQGWADSSECHITDAEQVQLRSFSTAVHNVLTKVQYKTDI